MGFAHCLICEMDSQFREEKEKKKKNAKKWRKTFDQRRGGDVISKSLMTPNLRRANSQPNLFTENECVYESASDVLNQSSFVTSSLQSLERESEKNDDLSSEERDEVRDPNQLIVNHKLIEKLRLGSNRKLSVIDEHSKDMSSYTSPQKFIGVERLS